MGFYLEFFQHKKHNYSTFKVNYKKWVCTIILIVCRAIQASLVLYKETSSSGFLDGEDGSNASGNNGDEESCVEDTAQQLRLALRLSEQQQMEEEQRRLLEEETFQQVLQLSLTDKWAWNIDNQHLLNKKIKKSYTRLKKVYVIFKSSNFW